MSFRRANADHEGASLPDENAKATPEPLARLAELIADGRAVLPPGLSADHLQTLIREVRRRRRDRLIQFIGRAVARDLYRGGRQP